MCLDKYVSAYVDFRQIRPIRQYLTVEATKTLACAFLYYLAVPSTSTESSELYSETVSYLSQLLTYLLPVSLTFSL